MWTHTVCRGHLGAFAWLHLVVQVYCAVSQLDLSRCLLEREYFREAGGGQDESQVVLIALDPFRVYFASLCFIRSPLQLDALLPGAQRGAEANNDTGSAFLDLWVSP